MKVLIVEDETVVAIYLEALVANSGHEVCAVATSAFEAVERARVHGPAIAVKDIRLARGTNGIDAARNLRPLWRALHLSERQLG